MSLGVQKRLMQSTTWLNHHLQSMGGFRPCAQGSNQENWRQGQGNQGRNYGNYNREGHYVRDGNYNRDNNFTGVTMVIEMTGMEPMFLLKIMKLLLGMVEVVCHELRICCIK